MSILEQLTELKEEAQRRIEAVTAVAELDEVRNDILGRKGGKLTLILRGVSKLAAEERPEVGRLANEAKAFVEALIASKQTALHANALDSRLASERVDVTMPGTWVEPGRMHIINTVLRQIKDTFKGMGYSVMQGPEVETDYYNFEALNIPANHPSREMWDSFFLREGLLLRSHTSPNQVRTMEKYDPPVRIIVPGKCYRRDAVDATHFWEFQQVEGLLVDEGVTFADLKGTLEVFAQGMFGKRRKTRFNPS